MVLVYIFRRSQEQKQKEVAMLLWLSSWGGGGDLVDWSDDHRVGEKPMELGYVCG